MKFLNLIQHKLLRQPQAHNSDRTCFFVQEADWDTEAEDNAWAQHQHRLEQQDFESEEAAKEAVTEEREWEHYQDHLQKENQRRLEQVDLENENEEAAKEAMAEERAWEERQHYLEHQDFENEEYTEGPDWEAMAEQRNLEYAAALQEGEGIALHEKALEARDWVQKALADPESPLFQACVNKLIEAQPKPSEMGASKGHHYQVECWAQWDQQVLGFIRTWIWGQLKEQGFVREGVDANQCDGLVYETVFSHCWIAIYQFFLDRREAIQKAIQQPSPSLKSEKSKTTEKADLNLNFFTKTLFECFAKDWLSRLELDDQQIDTYLHERPSRKLNAAKAIWSLYESLIANHTFLTDRGIPFRDFMDDFVKAIEPNSSFDEYVYAEHCKEIELSLGLRTLAQTLSLITNKNLF